MPGFGFDFSEWVEEDLSRGAVTGLEGQPGIRGALLGLAGFRGVSRCN